MTEPNESAEDIFIKILKVVESYGVGGDKIKYSTPLARVLTKTAKDYANRRVKEANRKQRELCADNAKAEMKFIKAPMGFGGRKPRVVRDSVINAPEPT